MGVIAEEAVRIRADTAGFHSQVSQGVLGSVTRVAASAAGIFGGIQLGKGLFNATIKSAADFQTTLKVLQATTHASNADVGRLSASAQKLGADIHLPATSAKSAADAMLQLSRAGFTTNQTLAATRGVLLLSTAAEVDNATAADMVSKAIGAFGLKAKDANTVVNDFAGAANASQSSLADVGMAVTQAGAGFHALRIPVSDAATAIAEMAKQGITGGMAGAALNVAFTRLATPTKAAAAVMGDMGVHLFDSHQKFIGLRGAIEQMSPKLAAMTDQQRLSTLSVLGGTRGMKALADVLGVGTREWDRTRAAVTRAGQAQEIANAKTAGFHGAVLGLQNTLGALGLKIGIAVLPKVTELVRWLGRLAAAPNFSVAVRIAWTGIKEFAGNVEQAISDALFGSSHIVHIGGHSTGVVVDPGLIANLQKSISDGIASTNWDAVGKNIGDAISGAINIGDKALNKAMGAMQAWLSSHTDAIAEIGLVIGLTMLSKLLDPGFWMAHWQLIGGLVLSGITVLFPEGKLAELGVKAVGFLLRPFAALGTRLAALGAEGVLRFAVALETRFGPLAGQIGLWIGNAILNATGFVVSKMVDLGAKLIAALINKISSLNLLFRTAIFTAVVGVIGGLIGAAVSKAGELAAGVAKGILTAPAKLAGFAASMTGRIVGALGGIIGDATSKAGEIASAIANGIKSAPGKITGLAGDLIGKIASAAGQTAGEAFNAMRQVGFSIADGVLSGVGNLASRLASAVGGAAKSAVGGAMNFITGRSPSKLYADTVGKSIGEGVMVGARDAIGVNLTMLQVAMGRIAATMTGSLVGLENQVRLRLDPAINAIGDASKKMHDKVVAKAKEVEKPIADAFVAWIGRAKDAYDAKAGGLIASVDATFAKAQAKIDAWKAQATPTEALIKLKEAQRAQAAVDQAVAASKAALVKLDSDFSASWAKLLADQAKNMAALKSQQAITVTDTAVAQHEFDKTAAATGNDPLAQELLAADQALISVKARYAAGTATLDELNGAVDRFDAAQLAATNDTDAQKLLADYTTWQGLLAQTAAGAQGILDQQNADNQAQADAQTAHNDARLAAEQAVQDTLTAQQDLADKTRAENERVARDAAAASLSADLKARHDRIILHLQNVIHAHDLHFAELARMATRSGGTIGENLAQAMRDSIPLVESAASALANTVKKFLKTGSPTEAGPMADLDTWWTRLAPTLVASLDTSMVKAALTDATTAPAGGFTPGTSATTSPTSGSAVDTSRVEMLLERIDTTLREKQLGAPTEVNVTGANLDVYRSRR